MRLLQRLVVRVRSRGITQQFVLLPFVLLTLFFTYPIDAAYADDAIRRSVAALVEDVEAGEIPLEDMAEALIAMGERYPNIGSSLSGMSFRYSGFEETFAELLKKKVEAKLQSSDSSNVSGLSALGKAVLGPDNVQFKKIFRMFSLTQEITRITESGTIDDILRVTHEYQAPEEQKLLKAQLSKTVAKYAERSAAENDLFKAIKELAELNAVSQSEKTDELLVKVLEKLASNIAEEKFPSTPWTLDKTVVNAFVNAIATQNVIAKESLLTIYSWRAEQLVPEKDLEGAAAALAWVIKNRPDPNPKNNELRKKLLKLATYTEAEGFKASLLSKLRQDGGLDAGDKLAIATEKSTGAFVAIFIGLAVLVVLGVLVFIKMRRPKVEYVGTSRLSQASLDEAYGAEGEDEGDDEYARLLGIFDLEDGASEAQIKKAFRKMVKEYHPDAQGSSGVSTDSEGDVDYTFDELKAVYDRILEMRGGWFGKNR